MASAKKAAAAQAAPKKKGIAIPSRDERAAGLKEWVNKKMTGHAQLKLASEYELPFSTKRCPTGLVQLDVELRGGFPCGGLSQIVGPKNSCKTYLAWQVLRQQQYYKGEDFRALLAQTEMRADRTQARLAGVAISLGDIDIASLDEARQAAGFPPLTKEEMILLRHEVGHIDEVHGDSAESLFDVVLKAIEENVYHVIVIDSFGSVMSAAEAEADSLTEKTYGGAAKPITEFLRKMSALLTMDDGYGSARDVCIIGINQVRDVIGGGQNAPEYKSTGGKALEHAKFVDLLVTSGRNLGYNDNLYTSDGTKLRWVQTGKEVNWKIEKGKAGIHEGGRGNFVFDFRTGTADFYLDTLVAGVRMGVIEQGGGSWFGIPNPNEPGNYLLRKHGKEEFIKALAEDALERSKKDEDEDSYMNYIRSMCFMKEAIYVKYN